MEDKKFTRLTLEQSDLKVVWEVPYEDVNTEDMMNAINTIMIGMTFHESQVYKAMADYLTDKAYDKYEVIEICEGIEEPDYLIDNEDQFS